MKTAFLVLGAQRSGTSVTSHVLSRFGVDFGKAENFIQFEHNPIFFELNWVNQYNDELIKALGYKYTNFFLPVEQEFLDNPDVLEMEKELQRLIENEWNAAPVIGIKDPRISLTFPVWERALSKKNYAINVILAFRHPSNFLASNQKLFHNWDDWNTDRHLNFWLQLNLSAMYFTRNLPVYQINYDLLMENAFREIEKLAAFFDFNRSQVADAALVVNPSCQHHKASVKTGHPFADRCYELLCSQVLSPTDYLDYRNHYCNS